MGLGLKTFSKSRPENGVLNYKQGFFSWLPLFMKISFWFSLIFISIIITQEYCLTMMVIYWHPEIKRNNILPTGQHSARSLKLRSTLYQLLSYWDGILDELEQADGKNWKRVELTERFAWKVPGFLHKKTSCCCWGMSLGVPQGTVLGPIILLLHISGSCQESKRVFFYSTL